MKAPFQEFSFNILKQLLYSLPYVSPTMCKFVLFKFKMFNWIIFILFHYINPFNSQIQFQILLTVNQAIHVMLVQRI